MQLARDILSSPDRDSVRRLISSATDAVRLEAVEPLASEILRLLRVDSRLALEAAERVTLLADSTGDPAGRARALWVRGHALAASLRNREAIECYRAAAAAYADLGRPEDAARVAIGHVNALTNLGRYEDALDLGEGARRKLLRTGQKAAAARMDLNLGNIHHHLEKPTAALSRYDRALRVATRNGDAAMSRIIQMNRGTALSALGRLDVAERLYTSVREGARASGEHLVRAFADFNLGYIRFQKGELGGAYDTLDDARRTFESLDEGPYLTLTLIDLAELLIEVNRFAAAKELAGRARELAGSLGRRFERSRAAMFEGIAALGIHADAEAETSLRAARAAFREEGGGASEALSDMYLAEVAARRHDRAGAARRLQRAVATFRTEGLKIHEVAARLRMAALDLATNRVAAADSEVARAAGLLRRIPSPWLHARATHLRGRIAEARGELDRAVRHYRRAIDHVDSIRGRIGIDEFRVSFVEDKAPIYADLVEVLLRRGGRRAVGQAFAVVEGGRSRALVDLLAGRLGAAAESDESSRRLLARMQTVRAEVNRLSGLGRDGPGQRRSFRRAVGRAAEIRVRENELTDLMRRLERRNARLGALACGETVTLDEARGELPADATLVEYFLSPRGAWAFVLDGDARAVRLPIAFGEVTRRVARLRFHLEKGCYGREYARSRAEVWREATDHHLRFLAERLWEPLGVREGRVVVVPHGPLHSLPFAALPFGDGSRVVDRHVLSHLPSASSQRYFAAPAHRSDGERPAQRDIRVLAVEVTDERIPETRREIDEVRRSFRRGTTLRGPRATAEGFRQAAQGADVVHIATHGLFRSDDPALSALRFSDGWMSLPEIYGLRLPVKLVCLSACQSGRNWVGGGDELVGLTRGFLHAGAASLLVSLWPVDDASTADLMIRFYRGLRRGRVVDESLRDAMRELRREQAHPYYWSPFILVGGAGTAVGPVPSSKGLGIRAAGRLS